jgi:hypothetical protein
MKSPPGPPMTLGNAAAARVRLIVWCKACSHQVEPDPPKCPGNMAPGLAFSIGAVGSCARAAGAERLIWSSQGPSGETDPPAEIGARSAPAPCRQDHRRQRCRDKDCCGRMLYPRQICSGDQADPVDPGCPDRALLVGVGIFAIRATSDVRPALVLWKSRSVILPGTRFPARVATTARRRRESSLRLAERCRR